MPTTNQSEPEIPDTPDELLAMLEQAEAQVQHLKQELERRHREQHLAQHGEIDQLFENLEKAQVNWQQVREFFQSAISEYRSGDPWGEYDAAPLVAEPNEDREGQA